MTSTPDAGASMTVALSPGDQVGEAETNRWEIVRHLADGGSASVYAVRPATPQTAAEHGGAERAMKCLSATVDEISQIGGEADKIAAVEGHENVLGLITSVDFTIRTSSADRSGGGLAVGLVLELGAEDLYGFGRRMQPSEQAWAGVFEQVAAGLEHIHSRGIVHGDVKPSNVLRVGPTFKLADFGVSRPTDPSGAGGITLARTLPYLPPESCSPAGSVGGWRPAQAGDVWALAVAMHRMLTGRHITAGMTPEQQYELVCQARYSIDDRLSAGWRRLFADCLAHRPEDRMVTSAGDLRRRLADLAVPEDYVGVPWLPGAPRIVAALQGDESSDPTWPRIGAGLASLVLFLARPGGRVQGAFTTADILLDATKHLHDTAIPALAQQVRDAQRAANRAAEERDRLQAELARLATAGPDTEVVDAAESTAQIQRLSSEVTTIIRQRDQITRERDRLAREHQALVGQVQRLERELTLQRTHTADYAAGYHYEDYPGSDRRGGRSALAATLIVTLALVIALSIGLLVALLLTNQTPEELIDRIADKLRGSS